LTTKSDGAKAAHSAKNRTTFECVAAGIGGGCDRVMAVAATDLRFDFRESAGWSDPHRQWIVLWTKARQETAVARFLDAKGTPFFLPLVERKGVVRGKKTSAMVPLFPGYVFLDGTIQDGYDAIATKRVCQLIEVGDQPRFMHEIGQIRAALEVNGTLELFPFAVVGRRCRVVKGPFIGIEGVITSRLGQSRLVLEVGILGRGAALEIDIDLIEPLD
jgi:transcription termination/antitermination protein NusG